MDYEYNNLTEEDKKRMEREANYPWHPVIVGKIKMTEEEKREAKERLFKLIEEFERTKKQK